MNGDWERFDELILNFPLKFTKFWNFLVSKLWLDSSNIHDSRNLLLLVDFLIMFQLGFFLAII